MRQINPAFNISEDIPRIEVEESRRVLNGRLPASLDAGRLTYETHRKPGCFGNG